MEKIPCRSAPPPGREPGAASRIGEFHSVDILKDAEAFFADPAVGLRLVVTSLQLFFAGAVLFPAELAVPFPAGTPGWPRCNTFLI